METIFQDLVDDFGDKTNIVDDIVKEVKSLSHENVSLKTENAELKNQLKYVEDVFQTVVTKHSRRVAAMGNTTTSFFQTLADEFEKKSDLLEDLEEEVKALSHPISSHILIS
jgi:regulator of replication initiation timing